MGKSISNPFTGTNQSCSRIGKLTIEYISNKIKLSTSRWCWDNFKHKRPYRLKDLVRDISNFTFYSKIVTKTSP